MNFMFPIQAKYLRTIDSQDFKSLSRFCLNKGQVCVSGVKQWRSQDFLWSLGEMQHNTKDLFDMALAPPKMAPATHVE
jgi:hypothetical protein